MWVVNVLMFFIVLKWLEMRIFIGIFVLIIVIFVLVLIFDVVFLDIILNLWFDLVSGVVLLGFGIGFLYKYKILNGGFGVFVLMIFIYCGGNSGMILFIMNCIIFMVIVFIIVWGIVI